MNSPRSQAVEHSPHGFTLVELLVVIAIISILLILVKPALNTLGSAGDVSRAADDLSGVLSGARSYAIAHNTYTWVGIFEEDGSRDSKMPATPGVGRIVLSVVASKTGGTAFDPASAANPTLMDPAKLVQINKLVKIEHTHLASFPDGTGMGSTFDLRPAVGSDDARLGDANPPAAAQFPFCYPATATGAGVQYTFTKTLQFNSRGEVSVNSTSGLRPVIEAGLRTARGSTVDAASHDFIAVQITGVAGNVAIYRR